MRAERLEGSRNSLCRRVNVLSRPVDRDAAETRPRRSPAYHFYLEGIGYLHEPRPDPESARQSFTQALSIDPGLARAHVGLARTAWVEFGTSKDASKLQQSLRECSAALALDDNCAEAYEVRGNVQVALDSSMAAVTTFARGLALEPRNEVLRAALARLQEKLGHDAAAERLYREGVELQPHYWLHYYELGYFCYQRDDVERAARLFEQVYALVPKYFSGYNALGGIYVLIGRYADALPILERSVSMRPRGIWLWRTRASLGIDRSQRWNVLSQAAGANICRSHKGRQGSCYFEGEDAGILG